MFNQFNKYENLYSKMLYMSLGGNSELQVSHDLRVLVTDGYTYSKDIQCKNASHVLLTVKKVLAELKESMPYELSGDRDHDQFLTVEDMGQRNFEVLLGCHHQGQCEDDASYALKFLSIKDLDAAYSYLIECGIDSESLESNGERDDDLVSMYYLWMLAGDIQELEDTEAMDA